MINIYYKTLFNVIDVEYLDNVNSSNDLYIRFDLNVNQITSINNMNITEDNNYMLSSIINKSYELLEKIEVI